MTALPQFTRTPILAEEAKGKDLRETQGIHTHFEPSRVKRKPFPISPVNPLICGGGALDTLAVLRDGGTHVTARLRP